MEAALVSAMVVAAVVLFVTRPLITRGGDHAEDGTRAALEAEKEAKYREIRDAELDHHAGKLDEDEWRRLDGELRAEAIEILRRADAEPPATGRD